MHLGSAGHAWWPAKDGLSVAPKAANEALITGIAKEEGKHNIRANSVLVGVRLARFRAPSSSSSGAPGPSR